MSNSAKSIDEKYMQMALELAIKGTGKVAPNPLVGSVIVKNDKVIAKGYHAQVGFAHAEADALNNARQSVVGATLYCNLEPCCHTNKRTPPCAPSISDAGIKKVVIANLDPNPEVAGKGVKFLREQGIEVITGICAQEGYALNEIFFTAISHKRAFVQLKMAQTLDGKMATSTGDSKWITSEESRKLVHQHRLNYDAIVIGANTARTDDPSLTVRLEKTWPKIRLVLTQSGELPSELKIFNDEYRDYTWLVVPEGKTSKYQHLHCPIIANSLDPVATHDSFDSFDLLALRRIVYDKLGITSLYVEGGAQLHSHFIKQQAYDRISVFIAPKIIGAYQNTIRNLEIPFMQQAINFHNAQWKQVGPDMYFTGLREAPCLLD